MEVANVEPLCTDLDSTAYNATWRRIKTALTLLVGLQAQRLSIFIPVKILVQPKIEYYSIVISPNQVIICICLSMFKQWGRGRGG